MVSNCSSKTSRNSPPGNRNGGMEFHPQKCSVLRVTRSRSPFVSQYQLKGTVLTEEYTSKYLGTDLQSNLSWITHIIRVTKKVNNMLGFLRRNLRQASEKTWTKAYFTIARSNLVYCCTIWSQYQQDFKR